MQILYYLVNLGCLICFIIVLIKLFQEKGALHGILGLICGIYTFIWGWMHATRLNIKNIMLIWTVLLLASIGMSVMGIGIGANTMLRPPTTIEPVTTTP